MSKQGNTNEDFYDGFLGTSKNEWLEIIKSGMSATQFDDFVKGNEVDGVSLAPVYPEEDFAKSTSKYYARSDASTTENHLIQQIVFLQDYSHPSRANHDILRMLNGGVESLLIDTSSLNIQSYDFDGLLKDVLPDAVDISIKSGTEGFIPDRKHLSGKHGVLYINALESYITYETALTPGLNKIATLLKQNLANYRCLPVSGYSFANQGANVIEELALTLNQLVYYLDYFTNQGIQAAQLFRNLEVTLSTRSAFLLDIAKFRALPILIDTIAQAYSVKLEEAVPIRAESAVYNKTSYDTNSNLLRNATEAMAAIMGNCQKICLLPHNHQRNQVFADRMARNVLHMLREESHLTKVKDPLKGSYAVESLTTDMAEQVWQLFQKIEKQGGILPFYESGELDQMMDTSGQDYLDKVNTLKKTSVGANRYVPTESMMLSENDSSKIQPEDKTFFPFINGPGGIEAIRKAVDNLVKKGTTPPRLGILNFSHQSRPAVVASRRAFVKDICTSVGVEVTKLPDRFLTDDTTHSQIDGLVLVGDDGAYAEASLSDFTSIHSDGGLPLYIAGYSAHLNQNAARFGIEGFIHDQMNVPDFARHFFTLINFEIV